MIDSKMITDDNSNVTELNRNFNLIEGRHTFRDGDGIGVGDSNELSNKNPNMDVSFGLMNQLDREYLDLNQRVIIMETIERFSKKYF